jgi:hypothetical protein
VHELTRSVVPRAERSALLLVGAEHATTRTAAEIAAAQGTNATVVSSDVTAVFSGAPLPPLLELGADDDAFSTLTPGRVAPALARLLQEHGAVTIVAPPLTTAPDAAMLAEAVGAVALVAEYGRTSVPDLEDAATRLRRAGGTVAGVVLRDPESDDRRVSRT